MSDSESAAPLDGVYGVVLAAGMGTRMRSGLAKVLHPVLGRPLAGWAVCACRDAGLEVVVVVNHQEDAVRAALAGPGVAFARQAAPRGTGDAVASAFAALPARGTVVVLPGDAPLLRAETLRALLAVHGQGATQMAVTAMSVHMPDPAAYGRVLRDPARGGPRIVEASEAPPDVLAIQEINSGVYAFDLHWLRAQMPSLQPHPPKGELYLTDMLELAAAAGRAAIVLHHDSDEVMGVNDRVALGQARDALVARINQAHALAGVSFDDPRTTEVGPDCTLGQDVHLGPGVLLRGRTAVAAGAAIGAYSLVEHCVIGAGASVGAHCVLRHSQLADGADVADLSHCERAQVDSGAHAGPYARLRPGAVLRIGARVGNFVEVKNTVLEAGAKANHLSYLGDAQVGPGANVGAGTITCNYDGAQKHRTTIGAGAFIGSNTALVAPVEVGDGAIVGAGSVVVDDVPANALMVARPAAVVRQGAALRIRQRQALRRDEVIR